MSKKIPPRCSEDFLFKVTTENISYLDLEAVQKLVFIGKK